MAKIEKKMHGTGDPTAVVALPARGMSADAVLALALDRKSGEDKSGLKWGGIYHDTRGEQKLAKLQADVWAEFNNTNALYPTVFTSVRKFEAEVIAMALSLLHVRRTTAACLRVAPPVAATRSRIALGRV